MIESPYSEGWASKMKIYIKRLRKDHTVPMPQYMTVGASGMDLFASLEKEITLEPGERKLIPTGIAVAIPEGFEGQVTAPQRVGHSEGDWDCQWTRDD